VGEIISERWAASFRNGGRLRPDSSRQFNRKADEGSKHPDRNAQFEYINARVIAAQAQQQPVISVDTKKKEIIGNFKNGGTDYRPKGRPQRVNVHDFEDKELGKVVPYGVYDMTTRIEIRGQRETGGTRGFRWKAVAFSGWHEPYDGRLSRTVL
jgi:hypothetical protein